MGDLVLITGASGYIAQHTIKALHEKGYRVRGTVRAPDDAKQAEHLSKLCPGIELVKGDLRSDEGWDNAVAGCKYVIHMASPYVLGKDVDTVVKPAVEGTRRVLTAAAKVGVKRVVLTSSCASIAYGRNDPKGYRYTPADWTVPEKADVYCRSKTLAEKAAWEIAKEKGIELVAMNPAMVVGPVLSGKDGVSASLCIDLFTGKVPMVPHAGFGAVDVRDVAEAHVRALTAPGIGGKRMILAPSSLYYDEMARSLAAKFVPLGYKVSTKTAPYWLLWLLSFFDKQVRDLLPAVNNAPHFDMSATESGLGMKFRDPLAGFIDMGQSVIELNLVQKAK